jgi:hypothetical protein
VTPIGSHLSLSFSVAILNQTPLSGTFFQRNASWGINPVPRVEDSQKMEFWTNQTRFWLPAKPTP